MLVSLHRRYLTDEGLEAVMAFLNIVLTTVGDTNYRFPKCAPAVAHKGLCVLQ
ncbi:hypothetical protein MUCCIDRAFT_114594 [Mucor lusitanicus CBS 277.49]|uniref:Uncharacterized protein n=1 Tax=Mucor lusitanicus CBS 277.49 TaxID=747725 RepID=A0A168I0E1_MUCCL|nr:hypothetical protein MUCCIDRAFT_114594 [Mucor lusitanicus CBS 277.49]